MVQYHDFERKKNPIKMTSSSPVWPRFQNVGVEHTVPAEAFCSPPGSPGRVHVREETQAIPESWFERRTGCRPSAGHRTFRTPAKMRKAE